MTAVDYWQITAIQASSQLFFDFAQLLLHKKQETNRAYIYHYDLFARANWPIISINK